MFATKVFILFAVMICAMAEPPRRNFRTFARQEEADASASSGYSYEPPAGERLRLPLRFRQFARQEQDESASGYQYPKPTEAYGPPAEEATEEPSTEYGPPEATTESDTELDDDASTDSPQSELRSLRTSQYRKNAKLSRARGSQKLRSQPIQKRNQYRFDAAQQQYVYLLV